MDWGGISYRDAASGLRGECAGQVLLLLGKCTEHGSGSLPALEFLPQSFSEILSNETKLIAYAVSQEESLEQSKEEMMSLIGQLLA